ncbi:MAG: SDR family NAD(P)-dependent oxidoreductase [Planctomycetaceae bacterium]|nr:SDR family NAD(P)-dependent oxidoreductase [Planctomycetaceae bacterium]
MRRKVADKRLLVTGASSGIGKELAIQLAAKGARLLVTARRGELLDSLVHEIRSNESNRDVAALAGDITDPDFRFRLIELAQNRWGRLDGLVNNAGVGAMGRFTDSTPQTLRQVMEVNFFAPVELIRLAIPLLQRGQQPIIVNMGSVLGHRAVPLKSEYCASKFALHGLGDALRAELAPLGIDLTMISPSTTDSDFFEHAIQDTTQKTWKNRGATSVKQVAAATIRAMSKGTHDVILTLGGKSLVLLDRIAPTLADHAMQRWAQ